MYTKLPFRTLLLVFVAACSSNDPGSSNNGTNLDGGMQSQDAAPDSTATLPPGCTNTTKDGTETDVDCGGSTCPACVETLRCITGSDCESTVCRVGKCAAATCNDNVLNQDESDSDCGGTTCSGCGNGRDCGEHSDCLSGFCNASGTCANSCPDGEVNGSETDVDCGGDGCPACADGKACSSDSDCVDMACSPAGMCVAHCTSMSTDSNETDEDCGGPDCDACADGKACVVSGDCSSGVCTSNICQVSSCTDGARNGLETDVDCGGPCSPCGDGKMCNLSSECTSLVCDNGMCGAAGCTDGILNGTETDLDCGGGSCTGCMDGQMCNHGSHCLSGNCKSNVCVSECNDGINNGDETDVDCGGSCSPCDDGDTCSAGTDCRNKICNGGQCSAATCADNVLNGTETDVDCGGTICVDCADGQMCAQANDCVSQNCNSNTCVSECTDNIHNGDETDVDCGGSCGRCVDGQMCNLATECMSMVCMSGVCSMPACVDGVLNGSETDVDCGGPDCAPCLPGDMCLVGSDCNSTVCNAGVCTTPTCSDGLKNQDETDVDCGGTTCVACSPGDACLGPSDCDSAVCTGNLCQAPTCTDGVKNATESDVDCGGPCDPCADGLACTNAGECESGVCTANICQAPTCTDGVLNGTERNADCGGLDCTGCAFGKACRWAQDCASHFCADHLCNVATSRSCRNILDHNPGIPSGTYTILDGPYSLPFDHYCDMVTDGGGWTLVAKSTDHPLKDDQAVTHDGLAVHDPSVGSSNRGIWGRAYQGYYADQTDIRFACYKSTSSATTQNTPFDVDMSFYENRWYDAISSYDDLNNDLTTYPIASPGVPARKNNVSGLTLPLGNTWNSGSSTTGGPIGEDTAADLNDFKIDFDDRGMNGNDRDGTDWGEDDGVAVCGDAYTSPLDHPSWYIFVRERGAVLPAPSEDSFCDVNGMLDGSETGTDCGGGNCPLCVSGTTCIADEDCESLNCTSGTCGMPAFGSCKEILDHYHVAPSGTYDLDPGALGGSYRVYCEMDRDGGGWTLVASVSGTAPQDQAGGYHTGLMDRFAPSPATVPHSTSVWSGMRAAIPGNSDIRFACQSDATTLGYHNHVDLAFYDVDWYRTITTGTDAQSCMVDPLGPGGLAPGRRNIWYSTARKTPGDQWDFSPFTNGGPTLEATCGDTTSFMIDYDHQGYSNPVRNYPYPHENVWGTSGGNSYCSDIPAITNGAYYIFVR